MARPSLSLAHLLWEEVRSSLLFLAVTETGEIDPKLLATVHPQLCRDAS